MYYISAHVLIVLNYVYVKELKKVLHICFSCDLEFISHNFNEKTPFKSEHYLRRKRTLFTLSIKIDTNYNSVTLPSWN